jgi:hypothetical protein
MDGNSNAEIQHLRKKLKNLQTSYAQASFVKIMPGMRLPPPSSLEYPMPATTIAETEWEHILWPT